MFPQKIKRVREMLCEYILKETIDRKGNFYNGASWVHCSQNLETHSIFFSQVLLPEKPAWLAWFGSDAAWFRQFSHDSIQTSPDEGNLKLDVIDPSLSINVIFFLVYKCDLACLYLWCENVFVMSSCRGGCHILAGPRMADAAPDGCQILAGSRMQPASGQVTVGVAYISVTGVN
jgi:hypothetical protein